ncbi:DUF3330 domain-containing protein [bacterium]|nr:DUF3330 domain-containing protein [bacterium]
MSQRDQSKNLCDCKTCCLKIPKSAAMTDEGADYVWYFCGINCYEKWLNKQNNSSDNKSEIKKETDKGGIV